MQSEFTQLNAQKNEISKSKQAPAVAECWAIFNETRRFCDGLWGPLQAACDAAALAALTACLVAT